MSTEIEKRQAITETTDGDTGGSWQRTVTFFAPIGASDKTLRTLALEKAQAQISMVPTGGGLTVRIVSIEPVA